MTEETGWEIIALIDAKIRRLKKAKREIIKIQKLGKGVKMSDAKEKAVYAALDFMKAKMDVANSIEQFKATFPQITDAIYNKLVEIK